MGMTENEERADGRRGKSKVIKYMVVRREEERTKNAPSPRVTPTPGTPQGRCRHVHDSVVLCERVGDRAHEPSFWEERDRAGNHRDKHTELRQVFDFPPGHVFLIRQFACLVCSSSP
jgi:hypothetical protein